MKLTSLLAAGSAVLVMSACANEPSIYDPEAQDTQLAECQLIEDAEERLQCIEDATMGEEDTGPAVPEPTQEGQQY